MISTNDRPENEVWLHDVVMQLETDGRLGHFCRHVGVAGAETDAAEMLWPAQKAHYKAHYTLADGTLDVAQAGRDFLTFPPTMQMMAEIGGGSR